MVRFGVEWRETPMLGRFLAAMLAVVMVPAAALARSAPPSSETEQVARSYMQAYSDANWDAMAPYMGDEFVLIDRTNPDPAWQPEHHGREATLQMLHEVGRRSGIIRFDFEFPTVFESNNIVVFSGFVNAHGAPPGVDYAYRWRAQQVTVLTFHDGRVVRHEDYTNYRTPIMTRLARP